MFSRTRWATMALALVVCYCVLSFYRASDASQRTQGPAQPPFASAVEQRMEMIDELKGIRGLLQEQNRLIKDQNELLRSLLPNGPKAQAR
jgi:hypothetical protein